jgi:hypothetical protein
MEVFEYPQQLGACQSADDSGDGCIQCVRGQRRSPQFPMQDPEADQCPNRHHDSEAGDLEVADPEEYGIHSLRLLTRARVFLKQCAHLIDFRSLARDDRLAGLLDPRVLNRRILTHQDRTGVMGDHGAQELAIGDRGLLSD